MPSSQNKRSSYGRFNRRNNLAPFLRKQMNRTNNQSEYSYPKQEDRTEVHSNRQNAKWTDPAIIVAIISIAVSIGMMVYTALLFNETVRQRKLTEKATDAAVAAAKEAKRGND